MSDILDPEPAETPETEDDRFEPGTTVFILWAVLVLALLAIIILIGYSRPPAGL
jgi:hypothetical protein